MDVSYNTFLCQGINLQNASALTVEKVRQAIGEEYMEGLMFFVDKIVVYRCLRINEDRERMIKTSDMRQGYVSKGDLGREIPNDMEGNKLLEELRRVVNLEELVENLIVETERVAYDENQDHYLTRVLPVI